MKWIKAQVVHVNTVTITWSHEATMSAVIGVTVCCGEKWYGMAWQVMVCYVMVGLVWNNVTIT